MLLTASYSIWSVCIFPADVMRDLVGGFKRYFCSGVVIMWAVIVIMCV